MQLNYLGHACFCIKSTNHSLVIDPFGDIGYKQEFCEVDYCLTTHDHFDHCTLTNVKFKQLIDKNTIDLYDVVWENIILEKPISITKE